MEDNTTWDLARGIIVDHINGPSPHDQAAIWRTLHIMALEIQQLKLENADLKERIRFISPFG